MCWSSSFHFLDNCGIKDIPNVVVTGPGIYLTKVVIRSQKIWCGICDVGWEKCFKVAGCKVMINFVKDCHVDYVSSFKGGLKFAFDVYFCRACTLDGTCYYSKCCKLNFLNFSLLSESTVSPN